MYKFFYVLLMVFVWLFSPVLFAQQSIVNVYNARHYLNDERFYQAFTEKTGIQVRVVEGKNDELIQRLLNEGKNSEADVLMTVDAAYLTLAYEQNLLQAINTPVLEEAIPEHLKQKEGFWYGLALRARVIAYAKEKIKPEQLSTYEALAQPQFKGKLLSRSSSHVYTQSLVASILAANGSEFTEKWAAGIVANFARTPEGGDTDQLRAIAAGVGELALVNTYYIANLLNSSKAEDRAVAAQIGVFFPNQTDRGTHVNISGAGVIKYAPHRENAIKLLEYLATEGQRYFADANYEYPANPIYQPHPTLEAFGSFRQDMLNAAIYGANNAGALKIMNKVGWK